MNQEDNDNDDKEVEELAEEEEESVIGVLVVQVRLSSMSKMRYLLKKVKYFESLYQLIPFLFSIFHNDAPGISHLK